MVIKQREVLISSYKQKILLTGARSLFTLDLARRFSEQGHRVFSAETTHFHVCRFSNAIEKNFVIPSPRFRSEAFINALVDIAEKEKIDWVIPSFEEIFCLSKGLDRFPKHTKVFCSPYDVLDSLHNKWFFNKKIQALGFNTPNSFLIRTQEELSSHPLEVPYILKPCYSRAAQRVHKVDVKNSPPKMKIDPHNPWVAQEWLKGKKFCSYSIAHEGKLFAHSVYPVQFSIDDSSCLNFESIEHPKIFNWIETFIQKESFTGQIAFDFIETQSDKLYAIECNPRGTSGLHLFRKEDHLPKAFFKETESLIKPSPGSSKQLAIGMMLYGWKNKKFSRFLKKLFSIEDVVFSKKDLKPFFFQPILFVVYIIRSIRMKTRIPTMFTFDIDWNGEARTTQDQVKCEEST